MPQVAWPIFSSRAKSPQLWVIMSYQVLARRWRPQTFGDIVGQEHVTTTLGNALAKGRVAHAYLFTGPRGCGKTTMARLLAKALNCDEGPTATPCGVCPACKGIAEGTLLDVLEIDAASHTGVDNIRELRENAQYQPSAGKKRIFIIDEVHMLSKGAFNALLKTLEEPPEHVHFIFATTEPTRIPRTILSRCQRFDFRLFTLQEIRQRLELIVKDEKREVSEEALELLAAMAEGSMRDALSLLDQAFSSVEGKLEKDALMGLFGLAGPDTYLALNDAILARDSRAGLDLVDELNQSGFDLVDFARGLVGNFRDLLLICLDEELATRVEKPEAVKRRMQEQAREFSPQDLLFLTQRAAENYSRLERAPQPRWLLEAQIVEYTRMESQVLLSEILGRLEELQEDGQGGASSNRPGGGRTSAQAGAKQEKARAKGASQRRSSAPGDAAAAKSTSRPAARMADSPDLMASMEDDTTAAFSSLASRACAENMGLGTCLLNAVPQVEGDHLLLKFAPEHAFHRGQLEDKKVLSWLSSLTADCFGRTLKIETVLSRPDSVENLRRSRVQREIAPTAKQRVEKLSQEHPGLNRLLTGLGGQVSDES